jgi:TetR/AcrR family transcriptional repressor of nem operon
MDQPQTKKALTRDRIVDAAARAIRSRGYAGVGVADVMKDAGLTHGGFYAHFPSRDALLIAALERAGQRSAESIARHAEAMRESGISPFRTLVENYLHDNLLKSPGAGCPVAALCSEMPRQEGDVRRASTVRVRSLVRFIGKSLPDGIAPDQAGVIAATLVGSLQLARTMGNRQEGKALLAAARRALIAQYDRT